MESIIKNGTTIINMPKHQNISDNKSGYVGVYVDGDLFKAQIQHNEKRCFLGSFKTFEEAKAIRQAADEEVKKGTFLEWYKANFAPNRHNKFGVVGLAYRNDWKVYQLGITYKRKKYHVGNFKNVEDAAIVRSEADIHIKEGTFLEWLEEYKTKRIKK